MTDSQNAAVWAAPDEHLSGSAAASVSTSHSVYPHGDRNTISWESVDDRGTFDTTFKIAAVTNGPRGSSPVAQQVDEFTELKPRVSAAKGKEFRGRATDTRQSGRFCEVRLRVEGFADDTDYKVKVLMSGHKSVQVPFTTDVSGTFSGSVYAYGDPTRRSWVALEVKGVRSKKVTWQCGGF